MLKNYTEIKVDEVGTKFYHNEGKLHRLNGPALENSGGTNLWFINENSHRNINPSVEMSSGEKFWCFKNELHRVGGCSLYDFWFIHNKKYIKEEYFNIVWDI